jgi:hypothetical protein
VLKVLYHSIAVLSPHYKATGVVHREAVTHLDIFLEEFWAVVDVNMQVFTGKLMVWYRGAQMKAGAIQSQDREEQKAEEYVGCWSVFTSRAELSG